MSNVRILQDVSVHNSLTATSDLYVGRNAMAGTLTIGVGDSSVSPDSTKVLYVSGDTYMSGTLTVAGSANFVNTTFTTTSSLSVENTGTGPAVIAIQRGEEAIAAFYDDDNISLWVDGVIERPGHVGIGTETPNEKLTVVGNISSNNQIYGESALFTQNVTAYQFIGIGSQLTSVLDTTKLPLSGGTLTGGLTGTVGVFTVSLSAPNLSGAFYGDGSGLTNVNDITKLPLSGGELTGVLSGTEGLFTVSLSAPNLSGAFYGDGSRLTGVSGIDSSKLPLAGGELTGPLTGTEGLFTVSLSAPNLSGSFYGDGSGLTGVSGTDNTKLPLAGGELTGPLTGTEGLFTISLSAPNLSGAFYGDGSGLTNVAGTDSLKLPLTGGELTGPLTGTEGLFTISLSAPNLSGAFYGDGSRLTGVSGIDGSKLPLAGGVLSGPLTGTIGLFTISLSAPNLSGSFYGDGSGLTNVTGTDNTKLPLSGGRIDGNLVLNGSLTALSGATFVNTTFTTTSALSIVNTGIGPALYVWQSPGTGNVASFVDGDGIEVLHIGNDGLVGIDTSTPNKQLTVNGEISANNDIWGKVFHGDGSQLTNVLGTDVSKLPLSGGTLTDGLTGTTAVFNSISAQSISGTFYGDMSNALKAPHYFVTCRAGSPQTGTMNTGVVPNTFTYTAPGALGTIDNYTPVVGDTILFAAQAVTTQNGPWEIVNLGGVGVQAVLQRPSFFSGTVKYGMFFTISKGSGFQSYTYAMIPSPAGSSNISVGSSNLFLNICYTRGANNATNSANTFTSTQTLAVGSPTTAPLRFQAGTLLTTPVQHSVEWDGNFMYLTTSGANSARTTNVAFVSAPATSSSYGLSGQVAYDSSFFYVCTAANTWLKTPLTTSGISIGIDGTKLPLSGGSLTGTLTGTVGLFTTSLSAPNLSGSFYGDGSRLTGVSGTDNTKLPLVGGVLTGPLTGTVGLFTTSLSSLNLSGTHYGDGSRLTGVLGTDNTKLPLAGGVLTGPLTGTVGLFTTSLSSSNLSGTHYGDGSKLTGIASGLPLGGGTLTGGLTGTTATFTSSISSPSISGTFYGDGGNLYNLPSQINFVFDGGGAAIELNSTGYVQIPYNIKIVSWTLLSNSQSNSEVQVLTSNFANHPTYTVISGTTNGPKLINAAKAESSTMTDWVTAIPANSYLQFVVTDNDSALNLTVSLKCLRTS